MYRSSMLSCVLQKKRQGIMGRLGHVLEFSYQDPSPDFNRREVRGPIARLATPKDPKHATALEVAAGGKLGHVVVDTDKAGVLSRS
jgi:chromosome segregation ATPase